MITGLSHWSAGSAGSPSDPHWLVVDLQRAYSVGQIIVCGLPHLPGGPYLGFTNDYNLYTSTNGTDWILIGSGSWAEDTDPAVYSDTFVLAGNPLVRYVKYKVVGGSHWADLEELEIFAGTPICGDGQCTGGETWESCPGDCPRPRPVARFRALSVRNLGRTDEMKSEGDYMVGGVIRLDASDSEDPVGRGLRYDTDSGKFSRAC
jgi:hypothetical protein